MVTGNVSHWKIDGAPHHMLTTETERSRATGLIRLSQTQGRNAIISCQYTGTYFEGFKMATTKRPVT